MGTEIHGNVKAKNFSIILTTIAVSKSHPGRPACNLRTANFSSLFARPYEHTLFIIIAVRRAVVRFKRAQYKQAFVDLSFRFFIQQHYPVREVQYSGAQFL